MLFSLLQRKFISFVLNHTRMGIKKIVGRTIAGAVASTALFAGVQHCGDIGAFFKNSGVVAKSFASTTIGDAVSYSKRAFTTEPGEYLDELREQGKKLEDVLRSNQNGQNGIQSGDSRVNGVLQAIVDMLNDHQDLVRRYRTSEANLIEAEREVTKSIIEYNGLSDLVRALDKAADLTPKYEADLKRYTRLQEELGKNPTHLTPKKCEAVAKERDTVRERLVTTATTFFEVYAAGEKARQELARVQREQKSDERKYTSLSDAVAQFAPYMEREELNALLDKAIGSVTAFYDGEARYQRQNGIAQDFIHREMSAGDLYQADTILHRRLDDASRIRRFGEEAVVIGKLSKQARVDAIIGTTESLRESSPEEWNALARYLTSRIPGEQAASSVQNLLDRLSPEQEAGLHAYLGNRIALRQAQEAQASAQAQTAPAAQAYAHQQARPAQRYGPAVDAEDRPAERTLVGRIADFAKSMVQ